MLPIEADIPASMRVMKVNSVSHIQARRHRKTLEGIPMSVPLQGCSTIGGIPLLNSGNYEGQSHSHILYCLLFLHR